MDRGLWGDKVRGKKGPHLYVLADWVGEELQSPCTLGSQKAAGRNLVSLLSHTVLSHLEARDEALSRFLCSLSTQLSEVPGFFAVQSRRGWVRQERGTLLEKRTCPLRSEGGRLGSVRDVPGLRSALARWLPKAPGQRVPANLGRSKTRQSSTCSPPPSHAPWDPTPSPACALILQQRPR